MSQNELQKLLYAALASGSQSEPNHHTSHAAALESECNRSTADLANCTPAEIIAHYDFRARNASRMR